MVELISRSYQMKLAELLTSADRTLLVAAPYIKRDAAQWLLDTVAGRRPTRTFETTILTDISPQSALGAGLDIDALVLLADALRRVAVFDVRRLHAKVYIADERQAIITSGNLTSSAFAGNYEYGVVLTDPPMVRKVSGDMRDYARAGRQISRTELARLDEASRDYRGQYQRASSWLDAEVRRELTKEWDKIANAFGAPSGVHEVGSARFKGPIMEVLASQGPLSTRALCDGIQASWPYLCDDAIIRVAKDGTRKRQWRHDIHTAQETLQRAGVLRRDAEGLWHIDGGDR